MSSLSALKETTFADPEVVALVERYQAKRTEAAALDREGRIEEAAKARAQAMDLLRAARKVAGF